VSNIPKNDKSTHYTNIRDAFLLRGSSLHAWCKGEGIAMQNARAALLGEWSGLKANLLLKKIQKAADISET
jgi:hypothetical protein